MDRKEEIIEASFAQYSNSFSVLLDALREAYQKGAKWSDEHPRNGLVNIDEVYEWLLHHNDYLSDDGYNMNRLVFDLRKAMEKES